MNDRLPIDVDALADEVERYLAAVDLFRALDSEPTWRAEVTRVSAQSDTAPVQEAQLRSAH